MAKLLEMDNITYCIGTANRQVRVTGSLEEGGFLNLSGPSGSGKTTLLRILARLRETGHGGARLGGTPWTGYSATEWRRRVHYLAQKPVLFDGTVRTNLTVPFALAAVKKEAVYDEKRGLELVERLFSTGEILEQDARTLSGGEASRLALIRALLVNPDVLLLDEPLAALDRKAAEAVMDLTVDWVSAKSGRGVVLVSHVGNVERLPGLQILEIGGEEALSDE